MSSLGELFFSLGLDDEKFNKAIEEAKKKVAELSKGDKIKVELDLDDLKAQIKAAAKSASGGGLDVGAKVDTKALDNMRALLEASKKEAKELEAAIASASSASVKSLNQRKLDEVQKRIVEQEAKIKSKGGITEASAPTPVKVVVDQDSLKLVKEQLAELGKPITATISVEYDTEKFHAAETAMKNFGKRIGESVNAGMGGSGNAPASTPTPKKGVKGWLDKVTDALMGEESGGGGVSSGGSGNLSSTLAGLNEQLAKLSENVDSINKKSSGRKKTAIVGEEEEMKRYLSQLRRLEEGVRRWQNVRANIEASKVDKSSDNYRNAISLIDQYIDKLEKAQASAGKFTDREMTEMLGQTLSGKVQETNRLVKEQKDVEKGLLSDFTKQQAQIQRFEESVRRIQNVKARLGASDVDKTSDNYRRAVAILDDYIDKLETAKRNAGNFSKREMAGMTGQTLSGEIAEAERLVAAQKQLEKSRKQSAKSVSRSEKEEIQLKREKLKLQKDEANLGTAKAKRKKAELQTEKEALRVGKERVSLQKKLSKGLGNMSNWASQLGSQLNNLISIYAIERFARSLYTIGGEFQKQQIALRNMIGDVAQADSTFERLKDLAVKSPFTFSDLASYTKQMAAYGIEYEELYDTTKRLADISAGVGVDMGRLILAYGQVRSAEVLRGQELRQFTEAGIPLVAELAKRLEEVRGESVKVGEVFDAISKRQVSFEMVKDVLFDMTDPGGRFFEMQEELAKSLAGQWSNLQDAWDIMIADIANSTNNVLSGVAGVAADLLRSWRDWAPALVAVASAFGVVTSAIRVYSTVTAIANAITKASPFGIAASIVLGAVGAIGGWVIASKTAEKSTSQLNTELEAQIQKWSENRSNALRYIDTLKSSNTSEERRIQLYNELLKLYPSVFENMKMEQVLLADTASLKTQVNEATKAMSVGEITKLIEEERKKIRKAEGNSVERGTFNGQEYKIQRKPLTAEQEAIISKAEARIKELEDKAAEVQRSIDREGLIKSLTPDSSLEKYVEVYRSLGKAVKILRQGGIKGELSNPKEFTTRLEYYDQLTSALKEQEEISKKFKIGTPERTDADKLVKVYRNAILAIGGIWDSGKGNKLSEAAKKDINAYIEALKNEISKIGKQWDLYKDLMEASGNKTLSMNIAFGGQISYESQLEQLKSRIMEEAKKFNVGISLDELLGLGEKQLLDRGVEEKAAKAIGALVDAYNKENEKLKDVSVKNFIEILNASKDFEQQIADIERELQKDLADLRKMTSEGETDVNSEEYRRAERKLRKNAEKDKANIRFAEFKESSNWVQVFDDLDRVATPTLDGMLEKMEGFVHQIEESPEAMKELLKAIGDMREKLAERSPFGTFARSLEKLRNINSARWLMEGNPDYTFQQDLYGFKKGQTVTKESLDNMEQGVYNDMTSAIDGTSKAFENLQNVLKPLLDLFDDGAGVVGKFLDGIGDALGAASSMSSSLEGLMGLSVGKDKNLGDALGIKNAGMWGAIAGAGLSIAGSLLGAFGADYSSYNEMKEEYDSLLGVWDALIDRKREYIDIDYADEARKVGQEALDILGKQIEAYRTLGKERLNAGASIGSHSIGVRIKNDMSDEGWAQFRKAAKSIGFNAYAVEEGRMERLFNLSAEQLAQLQEQAPVFWAKLDEDVRTYLENIIEGNEALEEMRKSLDETLTGTALDAFYDNYISMISDLDKTNQDFAESFEEYLKNAIIANVIGNKYRTEIEKLYQDWATMSDTDNDGVFDLTPEESDALKQAQEDLTEQLIAEREALKEAFGWTSSSSSTSDGLAKGVQGVTEDTSNLLASYVNAIRSDCSVERSLIERLVSDDIPRINYIAEAQLQQLNAIASNTLRNANAADKIYELMNRMSDKGSNKWRI